MIFMNSEKKTVKKSVNSYRNIPIDIFETYTHEDRKLLNLLWNGISRNTKVENFNRPIFTVKEFAKHIQEIYPQYFSDLKDTSISNNLRYYLSGGKKGNYPNLFVKNLIRIYPFVSNSNASKINIVAFPFENGYNINNPKNWVAKFVPHDPLHSVCIAKLSEGVAFDSLHSINIQNPKNENVFYLKHSDGNGGWLLDDILILTTPFEKRKLFVETYTGSEGYSDFFFKRLLTAQEHISSNEKDIFVFFFPFKKDVDYAVRKVNEYNSKNANQM